jgi:hypothetical protein
MPLRMLRKVMVAFATFDSVAACRACAAQNAPAHQREAPPLEHDANEQSAEVAISEAGTRPDAAPEARQ